MTAFKLAFTMGQYLAHNDFVILTTTLTDVCYNYPHFTH